jgi:hypothetical protein
MNETFQNHLSQEQLVDHYYGDGQAPDSNIVELHLNQCDECRAQYHSIQRVLNTVESYQVPEPNQSFETKMWRKVAPAIGVSHRVPRARAAWWAGGLAIAAMLVAAFFVGRATTPAPLLTKMIPAKGVKGAQAIPVLVVAVGDHLERVEAVLREIENKQSIANQSVDIEFEQEEIADLLDSNRLYRQSAVAEGDVGTASVLEDLENMLLEISHQPAKISARQLEELRREIKERGSLFKATVLGSKLRGEEATL